MSSARLEYGGALETFRASAPLGAYRLLGLPMTEISGQTLDLTDLFGAAGRRVAERLREAPSWRSRFGLLDELLLRRLDRGPYPSHEVARTWQRLVVTAGSPQSVGSQMRWGGATSTSSPGSASRSG